MLHVTVTRSSLLAGYLAPKNPLRMANSLHFHGQRGCHLAGQQGRAGICVRGKLPQQVLGIRILQIME